MNIASLNTLDLLLIVILLVGILIGLTRGALSQIISAFSIWLGLVATLWLYKIFSYRILQGLGIAETSSDTLAFLILLIVFFNAFRLVVKYLATPPEEKKKRRKSQEDPLAEAAKSFSERLGGLFQLVGGMVMGFFLTLFWITIILGVTQFILQPTGTDVPYTGFARGLVTNLRTSTLVPYFNKFLAALVVSLDLFVPRNADILRSVLEKITL
jgi:hypothetical protein